MGDPGNSVLGSAPAPGSRVGPYTIDAPLGSGGVASVYRASDPQGRVVALKILHPSRIVDEDVKRFTREYKALSRMDHANVVKVYEAGVHDGYPWIAIEHVDGVDLDTLIADWQASSPPDRFERAERVLRGLCAGLQYIHDLGLVHRDLKPSNVLVHRDGEAKLTDFGVVKDAHNASTALTMAGRLVGTVAFMAPEQITGDKIDARADLYALGAVLYVMLTFKRPIEASSVAGYLARHLTEVPKAPGEIDPAIPPRLDRICQRLLLKDPGQRYPTARAVLEALDRPEDTTSLPLRGREQELNEWTRRLGTLAQGGGGVMAVLGTSGTGRTHVLHQFADLARTHGIPVSWVDVRDVAGSLSLSLEATNPGHLDGLRAIEDRLRGRPRVIAADDLDGAPGAVETLGRLLRQLVTNEGEPLLLAFTATSGEGALAGLVDGTITGMPADVVSLGPLDRRAVLAIVRDRGLTGPAASVLGRRLHDDHEGNAGAVIEQLEALVAAGWLDRTGDLLRPVRPVEDLRRLPLPVPARTRKRIEAALRALDDDAREVVEALAVLDRPGTASLVAACAGDPSDAPRTFEALIRAGLLRVRAEADQEEIGFTHPSIATVAREAMSPERRRLVHGAVASALSRRRRREASLEVAHHLLESGDPHQAYPMFVQAARAAARGARYAEVFEIVERARGLQPEVEPRLDPRDAARHRRWLHLLQGEAHLARGEWNESIEPLEAAVEAAREEGDRGAAARCLGSLGRAHYRLGRFDRARPLLEEALRDADPGAPERAGATRGLADILLRSGDVAAAERLWEDALQLAEASASRDGEARARRGLAHVRVLQARFDEAARLLDVAEDMLNLGGDDRVRAGVLARSIELDALAGRYGSACRRCEILLELVQSREMPERIAEAHALCAEVRAAVGDVAGAHEATKQALTYAKAAAGAGDARIRAARVLLAIGHVREAFAALPRPEEVPGNPIDDPAAQIAALRARLTCADDPAAARDLAAWVVVRPAPQLAIRAARVAIDASAALAVAGDAEMARTAAKKGLKALQGPATEGLTLELLLALHAAAPDPRVLAAAGQLAERIAEGLPPAVAETFRRRPDVSAALAATGA